MTEKLKLRSLLFREGQLEEYLYLDEMLEEASGSLDQRLRALLDESCLAGIAVVGPDEHPTGDALKPLKALPRKHQRGIGLASMAMIQTYGSRDPVLICDVREQILLVVMPALKLESYIETRYGKKVSLPLPENNYQRWVASVSQDEELLCTKFGLGPNPNIARA